MTNSKVTLRDIYTVVNRLEDKVDRKYENIDERVNTLESFKDNLLGKITLFAGIISLSFTIIFQWVKEKFK